MAPLRAAVPFFWFVMRPFKRIALSRVTTAGDRSTLVKTGVDSVRDVRSAPSDRILSFISCLVPGKPEFDSPAAAAAASAAAAAAGGGGHAINMSLRETKCRSSSREARPPLFLLRRPGKPSNPAITRDRERERERAINYETPRAPSWLRPLAAAVAAVQSMPGLVRPILSSSPFVCPGC